MGLPGQILSCQTNTIQRKVNGRSTSEGRHSERDIVITLPTAGPHLLFV